MDSSRDVPRLPHMAMRRVLAFATDYAFERGFVSESYADDVVPFTPTLPSQVCTVLSRASPTWQGSIHELQNENAAATLQFTFQDGSPAELDRLCEQLDRRSETLRCLSLTSTQDLNDAMIHWPSIFARCLQLRRLSLALPLRSTHLVPILDAASTLCLDLEALKLPSRKDFNQPVPRQVQLMIEMLYVALERWFIRGRKGGLRQLTVPQRYLHEEDDSDDLETDMERDQVEDSHDDATDHDDEDAQLSRGEKQARGTDAFLVAVAQFCPNVEYVDGTDVTYEENHGVARAEEIWYGSKAAWEMFCASCTKLRELNWYAVPYVDDFFTVFSKYPKPYLKKLTMPTMTWDEAEEEDAGLNGDVLGEYYTDGDWTCSSAALAKVPLACPALEVLHIRFANEDGDVWPIAACFSDAFFLAVAHSCRQLSDIHMHIVDRFCHVLADVTDVGVSALASLETLRSIRLHPTHCGSAGVFALMQHAPTTGCVRDAYLHFAYNDDHSVNFGTMVVGVLDRIITHADALVGRRFLLTLLNEGPKHNATWAHLVPRLTQVARVAPALEIRLFHQEEMIDISGGDLPVIPTCVRIRSARGHHTVREKEAPWITEVDGWIDWNDEYGFEVM